MGAQKREVYFPLTMTGICNSFEHSAHSTDITFAEIRLKIKCPNRLVCGNHGGGSVELCLFVCDFL
jgi:hypothetical protein